MHYLDIEIFSKFVAIVATEWVKQQDDINDS